MPRPPLANPLRGLPRLRGTILGTGAAFYLFVSLIVLNVLQTLSLPLYLINRPKFRRFNRWCADSWWGWCVTLSRVLHGARVVTSGADVPAGENAILVVNHQQMADITTLMALARTKGRLGDLKWFVKDPMKYVPGVGWGMLFLGCVFVKRDWASDEAHVRRSFSRLLDERLPFWLIQFSEGTRITREKAARSRVYALRQGIAPTEHVLLPRTKGFVASVQGLRRTNASIYDLTIAYERGVPTLWQHICGQVPRVHLHVRRYEMSALPDSAEDLSDWLMARFHEKDHLLDHFYKQGAFPELHPPPLELPPAPEPSQPPAPAPPAPAPRRAKRRKASSSSQAGARLTT